MCAALERRDCVWVTSPLRDQSSSAAALPATSRHRQFPPFTMGFTSFVGRVLFSAIFIFEAWHHSGQDGGSAIKEMGPKLDLLRNHITSLGISPPEIELKYLLMAVIALQGLGGILFTLGTRLGAYLLIILLMAVTPVVHDFYNYDISSREYVAEFTQFLKNLSLLGGLLSFLGMKNYAGKKSKKKVIKAKAN